MADKTDVNPKTLNNDISDGSELIPAEAAARREREGTQEEKRKEIQKDDDMVKQGFTVDQEGLINNYPVTPPMEKVSYPSPSQQSSYVLLGGLAATFVIGLICIAFGVS